jgi:selenocysteine-specific elongation factor
MRRSSRRCGRPSPVADAAARPAASLVVGTAGHIDHGKTALLRALTGIDADRLPEERRRGMTIDVGYAHLALGDGRVIDFVDVPGHDRLVGNMLVGAGEIDAALLVVAADDGPNAQTLEHLELLDALGIRRGLAVVTKADLASDASRRASLRTEVATLLARTTLAGVAVLVASAQTGEGIDEVRAALAALVSDEPASWGRARLAVDRVFAVRGRGTVVTGSLRGGSIAGGDTLRLVPGDRDVRVREVQVRSATVQAAAGGRTALLLAGVETGELERGAVVTADPGVAATSRVLVAIRRPAGLGARATPDLPADRDRLRLHLGTSQVDALVVRGPREALDLPDGSVLAILRLAHPIAAAAGDPFALRQPSPGSTAGGGVVLDPLPPRGISRRRLTPSRAAALGSGRRCR